MDIMWGWIHTKLEEVECGGEELTCLEEVECGGEELICKKLNKKG